MALLSKNKMSGEIRIKILGTPIGNPFGSKLPKDGDGDGMFTVNGEDNVPLAQAAEIVRKITKKRTVAFIKEDPKRKDRIKVILEKGRDGGFTVDKLVDNDVKTGISIGRNKHGIKLQKSDVFDEDGEPTDLAVKTVLAWLQYHGKEVFTNPKDGAREVGIGGWLDGEDFYLDVVDIYPNTAENLEKAPALGKAENQISVANLDQIQIAIETDDWTGTTIDSGGDGAETMDLSVFKDLIDIYDSLDPPQISTTYRAEKKSLVERLTSLQSFHIMVVERKEDI
jgi:hypothetical protein